MELSLVCDFRIVVEFVSFGFIEMIFVIILGVGGI